MPLRALANSIAGETICFEIDRDAAGNGIVRLRVQADGVTTGEVQFRVEHLQSFRSKRLRTELLMPAWRAGFLGDWVLAGDIGTR